MILTQSSIHTYLHTEFTRSISNHFIICIYLFFKLYFEQLEVLRVRQSQHFKGMAMGGNANEIFLCFSISKVGNQKVTFS